MRAAYDRMPTASVQLVVETKATRSLWLVGAIAWFLGGRRQRDGVGTATIEELEPIIDGLLLDESVLGGVRVGVPAARSSPSAGRPIRGENGTPRRAERHWIADHPGQQDRGVVPARGLQPWIP